MILYYKNITKKVSSYYMILAFVSCSHRMDVKNLTLELANNTTFNINNDEWEDDDDDNDTRISSLKLQEGDFLIAREARDRNRNKKNPKGSFRFVYTGIGCQFKEQVLTVNDNDNKDKDKTVDLSSIETRLKFFKIRTHDEKIYVPCKKFLIPN